MAEGKPYLVAVTDPIPSVPLVRLHSACVFGESLHALDCDCGAQLDAALGEICREGGIIVYAWEEGRGAGIFSKVSAIHLQQSEGLSTLEAFQELGIPSDCRDYAGQIAALRHVFTGHTIRLVSRNPVKVAAAESAGLNVIRESLPIQLTPERSQYIDEKCRVLGHLNDS